MFRVNLAKGISLHKFPDPQKNKHRKQNFTLEIRKINQKNICSTQSTHYSDNTVLVLSKDTSVPSDRKSQIL